MNKSVRSVKSWLAAKSVIRMHSDDLTVREERAFEQQYDQDEQFRSDFLAMNQGLAKVEGLADDPDILAVLDDAETGVYRRPGRWRWLSVAAGVLLTVSAGLFLAISEFATNKTGKDIKRYVTRIGEQKSIELADGSVVVMNTATRLLVDISDEYRKIILERGEAYFDVAADPVRPFSVVVGERSATALGTEFNVRRTPEQFTLAVFEGVVAVHDSEEPVITNSPALSDIGGDRVEVQLPDQHRVTAGWVAQIDRRQQLLTAYQPENMALQSQWRTGLLRFDGVPLTEVVREINRYSAKKVLIEDAGIMDMDIYGTVRIDNLNSALKGLEKAYPVRIIYHFDSIVVVGRES